MRRKPKSKIFLLFILIAGIACGCTIAVISGDITMDGRPIIFKNRGIWNWDIEFKTIVPADGYTYAANTYIDEDKAWVGVNEKGFGIVQSAVLNISIPGDENGSFMTKALKYCVTVEDFATMVDSSDTAGRSTRANYGVMDSLGNIAMFECGHGESVRYDPDTSGFIVRANYAFIGDTTSQDGEERMQRAIELLRDAKEIDSITTRYIAKHVMGDLYRNGQNPHPLPFNGKFGYLDSGFVDTDSSGRRTLSSYRTTSAAIVRGTKPYENAELAMMYCYFGAPPVGIPFLLMPKSTITPPLITGDSSLMRSVARETWEKAYHHGDYTLIDTRALLDEYYNGIWEFSMPRINWLYDTTEYLYGTWLETPPSEAEITELQDTIVMKTFRTYSSIDEALGVHEIFPKHGAKSFELYPNPFNSRIHIDLTKSPELFSKVNIYDISGRILFSKKIRNSSSIIYWAPSENQKTGLYFVKLRKADGRSTSHRILYIR
ncbi:MAG: T9SS type A sorting domain-containing protein [Candidatus Zixiibacteriota bacterium]